MTKTLNIRYTEESDTIAKSKVICITSEIMKVEKLVSWILEYNHGNFDENGDVCCNNATDFLACQHKAKNLKLLPEMTITEIRARLAV